MKPLRLKLPGETNLAQQNQSSSDGALNSRLAVHSAGEWMFGSWQLVYAQKMVSLW